MKKFLSLFAFSFSFFTSFSQSLAINTDGSSANNSALLDVKSTTKGMLIPRMDSAQRAAIPAPAEGLLVYQTNKDSGFYYYDGAGWQQIAGSSNNTWKRSGNHIYNNNTGNVGIGITTPAAKLHVADSSVVFSAPGDRIFPPFTNNVPVSGEGRRMMWYADKAAFRAGYVSGTNWDKDSIGEYSFAAGYNTKAIGGYATAFGESTIAGAWGTAFGIETKAGFKATAFGNNSIAVNESTAFGNQAAANGRGSTAFGNNSTANGDYSLSAGYNSTTDGMYGSSFGHSTSASGSYATAFGNSTVASGNYSTSFGSSSSAAGLYAFSAGVVSQANGEASTAFGYNGFATGDYSFAAGKSCVAKAVGGVALGANNDNTDSPSPTANPSDRIFQIGNGESAVIRSNAVTVLRNGSVGIGVTNPGFRLVVDGDGGFNGFVNAATGFATPGTLLAGNTNITGSINISGIATIYDTLGIGTGLPFSTARLTVNGKTRTFDLQVINNASNGRILTSDATGNATWTDPPSNYWLLSGNDIYNSNTGNTGIGVTDPAFKLDVGARMRLRATPGLTAGEWLNNEANTSSPAFIGMRNDTLVGFYGNNSGWSIVMNTNSGRIGIGTETPAAALHVIGNIIASGTITPSDLRYKLNIQPINQPLQKLLSLSGVTYLMNNNSFPEMHFDETRQYGLIAQEVEKVFPEMVKQINDDGYKGIDYVKLIPVLIEAIRDLKKENNRQQQQIDQLTKQGRNIQ